MMTSHFVTSSGGFKEKNGLRCFARARTDMKNTKEYDSLVITVVKCFPSLM